MSIEVRLCYRNEGQKTAPGPLRWFRCAFKPDDLSDQSWVLRNLWRGENQLP